MRINFLPLALLVATALLLVGCATSRADKLEAKSERVERALLDEQRRVVAGADANRRARLDYLSQLRAMLSAANISLGVIPHTVPEQERGIAYDVLDEAYDTIQWNIPLGPEDQKRSLPAGFGSGGLQLSPR
ncbi:MAG: hypothetical protein ACOYN0_11335 [Phycisphaerales bacterium]